MSRQRWLQPGYFRERRCRSLANQLLWFWECESDAGRHVALARLLEEDAHRARFRVPSVFADGLA